MPPKHTAHARKCFDKKNASLMLYLQGVNNALEIRGSVSLITLAVLKKSFPFIKVACKCAHKPN